MQLRLPSIVHVQNGVIPSKSYEAVLGHISDIFVNDLNSQFSMRDKG